MGEIPKDLDGAGQADATGPTDEGQIQRLSRDLARVVEPFHSVTYYSPEINRLTEDGFKGWWHAYFGYRPAPLGPVGPGLVTAAFYNFAPRMVERAVPGVWSIMSPEQALARRDELVRASFDRIFASGDHDETPNGTFNETLGRAAELARRAMTDVETVARPLFAAHADLDWPSGSAMSLWHACTLWREYRGDSHNLALAAAGIDGIECHLLMSASGHGNQPTITGIRGWTEEEWHAAADRLRTRGLLDAEGGFTDEGKAARFDIERATDRLSADPARNLGADDGATLVADLTVLVNRLKELGEVTGTWPPPAVQKPDR